MRPLRLSDINGMSLVLAALAFTIVSSTLSEAKFRKVDDETRRIELARKAAETHQRCATRQVRASETQPKG